MKRFIYFWIYFKTQYNSGINKSKSNLVDWSFCIFYIVYHVLGVITLKKQQLSYYIGKILVQFLQQRILLHLFELNSCKILYTLYTVKAYSAKSESSSAVLCLASILPSTFSPRFLEIGNGNLSFEHWYTWKQRWGLWGMAACRVQGLTLGRWSLLSSNLDMVGCKLESSVWCAGCWIFTKAKDSTDCKNH